MSADYPDVNYTVAELPAGPGGKGTLQFTNCWGLAADSGNQEQARSLVEYLTSTDQQLAFSQAFGPMPSIQSAADAWTSANPDLGAFLAGAEYAQFPPNMAGAADVITDFNAQLESLKTGDTCGAAADGPVQPRGDRPVIVSALTTAPRRAGSSSSGIRRGEAAAGWLFTAPVLVILGVFLLVPCSWRCG